jgi:hypothetical protein
MRSIITIILAVFMFCTIKAQDNPNRNSTGQKGRLYFYWGWNWSWYSKSNIHFAGPAYDFTLDKVSAKDRQSEFDAHYYLNPLNITIPQYNLRVGYFISDNYSVSLGVDHMKYVVQPEQVVKISGHINDTQTIYNGTYSDDDIALTDDFLLFEHTDGLNYINADFRRFDQILSWKTIRINLTEGLGAGILYPKTNATLLSMERHDDFHLSGFGINGLVGININLVKSFFIQTEFKAGYINMPKIRTTNYTEDKANQAFFFYQLNVTLGASINLKKKDKSILEE